MSRHEEPSPQRLPPPVLAKSKKRPTKAKRLPWYRHSAWIIPLIACVVFAVLIAGGLAVRQVIVLVNSETEPQIEPHPAQAIADAAANEPAEPPPQIDEPPPSLESSEPGIEVLPPRAAKEPGRTLKKMLLVGRHPEMFPTLESALEAAIGGDFIEIRTNHPLEVAPQKAQWRNKTGPITIRAGQGYQPVLLRRAGSSGPLLTLGYFGMQAQTAALIEGLTFVDAPQSASNDNSLIKSHCDLAVRNCVLCFNHNGLQLNYLASPETALLAEQSYFYALRKSKDTSAVSLGSGRLSLKNNLIFGAGQAVKSGGGVDADLPTQADLLIEHNTLIACHLTLSLYAKAKIVCRDNLIAWRDYGYVFGAQVPNFQAAQARLNYRGTNNLYHAASWNIWQGRVPNNLAGWQRLTGNGERNAIHADPAFAHPELLALGHSRLVPPETYSLSANSPVRAAASDGAQIGAEVSLLPVPPPIAVWMFQHGVRHFQEN